MSIQPVRIFPLTDKVITELYRKNAELIHLAYAIHHNNSLEKKRKFIDALETYKKDSIHYASTKLQIIETFFMLVQLPNYPNFSEEKFKNILEELEKFATISDQPTPLSRSKFRNFSNQFNRSASFNLFLLQLLQVCLWSVAGGALVGALFNIPLAFFSMIMIPLSPIPAIIIASIIVGAVLLFLCTTFLALITKVAMVNLTNKYEAKTNYDHLCLLTHAESLALQAKGFDPLKVRIALSLYSAALEEALKQPHQNFIARFFSKKQSRSEEIQSFIKQLKAGELDKFIFQYELDKQTITRCISLKTGELSYEDFVERIVPENFGCTQYA